MGWRCWARAVVCAPFMLHGVHTAAVPPDADTAVNELNMLAASEGLGTPCRQAISQLSKDLTQPSTKISALQTVLHAIIASGRVMEALPLLNIAYVIGIPDGMTAKKVVSDFPFESPGNPDACAFIDSFHYCRIDLPVSWVRFGVCVPDACHEHDMTILLNHTFHRHDFALGMLGSGDRGWLVSKMPLEASTTCGARAYGFNADAGTYAMAAITLVLIAVALVATGIDVLRRRTKPSPTSNRSKTLSLDSSDKEPERDELGVPVDVTFTSSDSDQEIATKQEVVSTTERWFERSGMWMDSVLCFSLVRNYTALWHKRDEGPFSSLDGIRALSGMWIVLFHTLLTGLLHLPYSNLYQLVSTKQHPSGLFTSLPAQVFIGGLFAVDTFFLLSAFLAVYWALKRHNNGPHDARQLILGAPRMYVQRYLRLTPTYAYALLMWWKVMRIADRGPFYTSNDNMGTQYGVCERDWYLNLLYVNNFFSKMERGHVKACFPISWYLAAEFQMYLLVPFVAALARWRPRCALGVLFLSFIGSIAWSWADAQRRGWTLDVFDGGENYYLSYYLYPWYRLPPFLVGMALAVVWHRYLDTHTLNEAHRHHSILPTMSWWTVPRFAAGAKYRNRDVMMNTLLLVSVGLCGALVYGARGSNGNVSQAWSQGRMSAYIALAKPVWSLAVAGMCVSLFKGYGGPLRAMLDSWPLRAMSRLTYAVYLTHLIVLQWLYGMLGPIHWSAIWLIVTYLGVLCTVTLGSFCVHLLVEAPTYTLVKLHTQDRRKKPVLSWGGGRRSRNNADADISIEAHDGASRPVGSGSEKDGSRRSVAEQQRAGSVGATQ